MKIKSAWSWPLPVFAPDGDGGGGADEKIIEDAGDKGAAGDKGGDKSGADDKGGADKGGKKESKVAIDGSGDAGDKGGGKATDFPENWRDQAAGGNADIKKFLERAKTPADVAKIAFDSVQKIRSGKANADEPMPDPTKDADGAKAWREARGIPDAPTGYELPKEIQAAITDEDKPVVSTFMEKAHAKNWTPKQVAEGLDIYLGFQQETLDAQDAADKAQKDALVESLRDEWGPDYRANKKLADAVMMAINPELALARLPDGRLVGNVPELAKAFATKGREFFGDVGFETGDTAKVTENRITELQAIIRDKPDEWHANTKEAQKLRAEYERLVEARDKHKASPSSQKDPARA